MNQLVEYILAAMIATIPPGQSSFSQVPIEVCDGTCQITPRCENEHDFRCKPPSLNMSLYLQKQDELVSSGMSPEDAIIAAYDHSFTRPETYEEGLARYYVISEALVASSRKNSYSACVADNECLKIPEEDGLKKCHLQCSSKAKWQGKPEHLAWAMFTVSGFESGWRSDVQAGVGWAGRGDCDWEKNGVKVKSWTRGGRPVPGTCRSYGLNQAWFGSPARELSSYYETLKYDDVLGLDYNSASKSFDLAATQLFRAYHACRGAEQDWAWTMFSLYGSGAGCRIPKAKKRSLRFWQFSRQPPVLLEKHKEALETEEVQELISFLKSENKILWLPSDPAPVIIPGDEKIAARYMNTDSKVE